MEHDATRDQEPRRQAFERFVVPELGVLLHVARTMTRNDTDAEDLVQDTLLRAYQGIARFDGAHPRAWLFTIMRNAQMNRVRRRRPELLDDAGRAEAVVERDDAISPEDAALAKAFDEAVAKALLRLHPRMAQVVELVDMDGLTCAEAATALGMPVGTVMSRLHRARRKIREHLGRAGFAPRGGIR
jgi:RNA polymerase sigma-70 factor, ECF subfamily